ncbi:hypothetical protein Tco_1304989, partial [Tanacetum coccineum]
GDPSTDNDIGIVDSSCSRSMTGNKEKLDDFMQVKGGIVKDMLTKFDMESVRSATTPYEATKTKLKDESDPPVNVYLYRSMIGSLMYLTASR